MRKEDKIQVVTITCSNKDYFSKKKAKELFKTWCTEDTLGEVHPTVAEIPIEDNKPKLTFMKYCKANYKKLKARDITIATGDIDVHTISMIRRKGKYVVQLTYRS